MIKKEKKTKISTEGVPNAFYVEDIYIDEPIGKNIISSISDFYNLMHLIKKSWVNKKYRLKMKEAGYNIYDKEKNLSAWIGVKEKSESLMFLILNPSRTFYEKARSQLKGPMVVYDFDEDLWIFSELKISEILKEENFEDQMKVIKDWIDKNIKKIL